MNTSPRSWGRGLAAAGTLVVLTVGGAGLATGEDYFAAVNDPALYRYRETMNEYHTNKVPNLIREGRTKDALNELNWALERFPNHPVALLQLEVVGRLIKNPGLAAPFYRRALQLYPQYAITYVQYGAYLIEEDKVDDGIAMVKRGLAIDESLALAHVALAKAYNKKGQLDLASQSATRARALGYRGPLLEASSEPKTP